MDGVVYFDEEMAATMVWYCLLLILQQLFWNQCRVTRLVTVWYDGNGWQCWGGSEIIIVVEALMMEVGGGGLALFRR